MTRLGARRAIGPGFCGALLVADAPPAAKPTDGARLVAKADFTRDEARLNAWRANPEAIIPIMASHQPKAETRAAIIAYLKELN